jgi:hypothetical protein
MPWYLIAALIAGLACWAVYTFTADDPDEADDDTPELGDAR